MLGTTLSVANLKQPKPATMTLGEAKLRFAALPDIERNKIFSALFRMSLIDGRPISPIEPQDNLKKAQVPLKAVEKLDSLVKLKLTPTLQGETEDFKRTRAVQGATMRRVSEAPDNNVELRPSPESPTNHPFRQPALYEQIGDVFQGEGSAYRAAERGEAETTRNVSTAIQTQHPYMPQVVGDLLGSLAASGWTLAKQVSFFDPTKQGQATRDEINPTGTTGEDWTGALLNIASWFSAERGLAAGERALTAGALREVATAPNVGRALIENGVPPKEAAKVALGVEQAVKTAPDDDVIRPYSTEWTDVEIYNDMFKGKDKEFIQARIDATVEAAGLPPLKKKPIKKSPINAPKKATQEPTPVETPQATQEPAMAQSEAITEPLPGDAAPVLDSGTPNAPETGALTPESSVPVEAVTPEQATSPIIRATHTASQSIKSRPIGKVSTRTGMTKEQEFYLADGLKRGAAGGNPFSVHVPGDGKFTVNDPTQASTLHKAITGKAIDGIDANPLRTGPKGFIKDTIASQHYTKGGYVPSRVDSYKRTIKFYGSIDNALAQATEQADALRKSGAKPSVVKESDMVLRFYDDLDSFSKDAIAASKASEPGRAGEPVKDGNYWSHKYTDATGNIRTQLTATKSDTGREVKDLLSQEYQRWRELRDIHSELTAPEVVTPKVTPVQAAAEELGKIETPKMGGIKGKKKGVVSMDIAADNVMDAAESASRAFRSALDGVGNVGNWLARPLRSLTSSVERGAPISVKAQIRNSGPVGNKAWQQMKQVFAHQRQIMGTNGEALAAAIKSEFPGRSKSGGTVHRFAEGLGKKLYNSDLTNLTKAEQRIVATLKKLEFGILGEAKELGVRTTRHYGGDPKIFIGEEVRFTHKGETVTGKVTDGNAKGLNVTLDDGSNAFINKGQVFQTRQLIEPGEYIPLYLKEGMAAKLAKGGKKRDDAIKSLIDTGQADTAIEAGDMVDQLIAKDAIAEVDGLETSKLRKPRSMARLPGEYYDLNVLTAFERHFNSVAKDISQARVWGQNNIRLKELLAETKGTTEDSFRLQKLIEKSLGVKRDLDSPLIKKINTVDGALTMFFKLGPWTAIKQPSQIAVTVGRFGAKNTAKSIWSNATSARVRNLVRVHGGASINTLETFVRLSGADHGLRKGANWWASATGIKAMDRTQRFIAAVAGDYAVQDALKAIRTTPKGIKEDRHYRLLRDLFGFTDDDVLRMKKSGISDADRSKIFYTADEIQGITDDFNLPPNMTDNSTAGILYRLQSFNVLQAQNVAGVLKEAASGNPLPAAKMAVAGAAVGEGIVQSLSALNSWLDGSPNTELDEALATYSSLDAGRIATRAFTNVIEAGQLGLFEVPLQMWRTATEGAPRQRVSPGASTITATFSALARASKSEDEFIEKVKQAGIEWGTDVVPVARKLYKRVHGGKTPRQMKPLKSKSKSSSLTSTVGTL